MSDRPPYTTVRLRTVSKAMAWNRRAGGETAGNRCAQAFPFHSQVSAIPTFVPSRWPPKRTVTPRLPSYAIAEFVRGAGLMSGFCSFQLRPSHVQVSFWTFPAESFPPKRTMTCRAKSYVINESRRGVGELAGNRCVQV